MITLLCLFLCIGLPIIIIRKIAKGPNQPPNYQQPYNPNQPQQTIVFSWKRFCQHSQQSEINRLYWLQKYDQCPVRPWFNGYQIQECGTLVRPEWCEYLQPKWENNAT